MKSGRDPSRRRFLAAAMVQGAQRAAAPAAVDNRKGGFRFLRGIAPFSSGAAALRGYEVVHVTFHPPPPYRRGFESIDRHLKQQGRPPQALCGVELRSPRPFTFEGFDKFNQGYVEQLRQRGILADGLNPVARTNVAPEVDPPSEVLMYGFSYAAAASQGGSTFVLAGGGEVKPERLGPESIVRRGDVSPDGLREKAEYVLGLMDARLQGLGLNWSHATAVGVYTVHNIFPLMQRLLLPRLGEAKIHGVRWHFARPPIEEVEFEMDVRGCLRELYLGS